jgi:hypothetical protein
MRKISPKVKAQLLLEPQVCARRKDGGCDGRITFEHTLIYAGRQIDEVWAIIKLCEWHHAVNKHQDGKGLDKEKNVWIALNRATDQELEQYSKAIDYQLTKKRLNEKYGERK